MRIWKERTIINWVLYKRRFLSTPKYRIWFTLYLGGKLQRNLFTRHSDCKNYVLFKALNRELSLDEHLCEVDLLKQRVLAANNEFDFKYYIEKLNKKFNTIHYIKTNNVMALNLLEAQEKLIKKMGLVGVKEVDETIKLYDMLDKAGLIKMKQTKK